jgi:hypothetical protein
MGLQKYKITISLLNAQLNSTQTSLIQFLPIDRFLSLKTRLN